MFHLVVGSIYARGTNSGCHGTLRVTLNEMDCLSNTHCKLSNSLAGRRACSVASHSACVPLHGLVASSLATRLTVALVAWS